MTLNQIFTSLKTYFKRHALVNGVNVTIDNDDFNALTGIEYPVVNIQYIDTGVSGDLLNHNFKIIIGDSTNLNVQLIDIEIFSDCIQIADDFFGWLNTQYDFDWNKNTALLPFVDTNSDRTSGIVFTLVLTTYRIVDNVCQTPVRA